MYVEVGLSTVTVYGYGHIVYGWFTGTVSTVSVPSGQSLGSNGTGRAHWRPSDGGAVYTGIIWYVNFVLPSKSSKYPPHRPHNWSQPQWQPQQVGMYPSFQSLREFARLVVRVRVSASKGNSNLDRFVAYICSVMYKKLTSRTEVRWTQWPRGISD
jgi:hypothetical protein